MMGIIRNILLRPSAIFALLICGFGFSDAQAEPPRVVASIRPLHALVASVMRGVATPRLLVSGNNSPHGYQLKPSERVILEEADVIFLISPQFEAFLDHALESLPKNVLSVAVADTSEIDLLPQRRGGVWEAHSHEGERHHHDEGETSGMDYHVWLDPVRAKAIISTIETSLSARYPQHALAFHTNATQMATTLTALDATLATRLNTVKDIPFIVFHDGYQYMEARYGLHAVGSITLHPDAPVSVRRLRELRQKIAASGAICVFREPRYSARLVESLTRGTPAHIATLNPMEYADSANQDYYATSLNALASALTECLAKAEE